MSKSDVATSANRVEEPDLQTTWRMLSPPMAPLFDAAPTLLRSEEDV